MRQGTAMAPLFNSPAFPAGGLPVQAPVIDSPFMTQRTVVIVAAVLALHVGAIWLLQTGLLRRAIEVIVPAEMIAEMVTLPVPQVEPVPKPQPEPEPPRERPVRRIERPVAQAPQPIAVPSPEPAPNAPTGVVTPQPPAPPVTAPVAAEPAPAPAPPAPARVELPSSDADYLNNPKPAYPPASKRLGEQGKVLVRVLIGADGTAQKAELRQSSGFDRLDQAAIATVLKWRYVPGKRGGTAETMWFNVPINFVLE